MHNLTLSFSLALMCGITAYAQDVTETVVVETPGTLIDLVANLSSPRKWRVESDLTESWLTICRSR